MFWSRKLLLLHNQLYLYEIGHTISWDAKVMTFGSGTKQRQIKEVVHIQTTEETLDRNNCKYELYQDWCDLKRN